MSKFEKFLAAGIVSRLVTAVILVVVLITAWVLGGWYIAALVALIAVVGMGEFLFMFQPKGGWAMKLLGLLLGTGYV
ncbi:MAG: hypothetical protein IJ034_04435, partial [Mailhella sp.]|nr:hypothetical protein [Mailhella sp.]